MKEAYINYMDAAKHVKFKGHEEVSYQEYCKMIETASRKLIQKRDTAPELAPFIVFKIDSMYIKFKLISEEKLEVNFFTEDEYDSIISKYKENEDESQTKDIA